MVKYIKIGLCGLYNIWFYCLAATGIIICLPLFFIFSFKEEWYPQFLNINSNSFFLIHCKLRCARFYAKN